MRQGLFELHHLSPKWQHFAEAPVQYWPALLRDEWMLPVLLETDSNTADRSSSAEETGPTVFAICKMVSGNFKRKEKINKASLPFKTNQFAEKDLWKTLAKQGLVTFQSHPIVQMFQKRVIGCYWKVIGTHLRGKKWGTKQILSDASSSMPSQLLATPEHCLIGACVQPLLEQWVPPS